MRLLPFVSILALLAAVPGCEAPSDLAGVSEEAFISTMAELRRIERDVALDSAAKATARQQTLQERNLTPAELEAAARMLASDVSHALAVWARIDTLTMSDAPMPSDTAGM